MAFFGEASPPVMATLLNFLLLLSFNNLLVKTYRVPHRDDLGCNFRPCLGNFLNLLMQLKDFGVECLISTVMV